MRAAEDVQVELEEQAMVRLGLASLSPRCRRLIEALYYEDPAPAYTDVARRLGLPMGPIGPMSPCGPGTP